MYVFLYIFNNYFFHVNLILIYARNAFNKRLDVICFIMQCNKQSRLGCFAETILEMTRRVSGVGDIMSVTD